MSIGLFFLFVNRSESGDIRPAAISGNEQATDIFTKPLGGARFHHLLSKLDVRDLYALT